MSIKRVIQKVLPSYRASIKTQDMINDLSIVCKESNGISHSLHNQINELGSKIEYLFFLSQRKPYESELDTKKRVFLELPKASGELRLIQLGELFILERIKKICDDNGIEFFLSYGTLMGAVRHRGFIPWDDDIDISMMREEYNKFKTAIVDDDTIELNLYHCYFDFHDSNTTQKVKLKNSEAFFVDIFVYDYIDCENESPDSIMNEYNKLSLSFHKEFADYLLQHGTVGFCSSGTYIPRKLLQKDDDYYISLYDKYRSSFDRLGKGEYICLGFEVSNAFINKIKLIPKKHYLPLLFNCVEFEGKKYSCPKNYEDYLNVQYGDIWHFPDSLYSHHLNEIGKLEDRDLRLLNELGIGI